LEHLEGKGAAYFPAKNHNSTRPGWLDLGRYQSPRVGKGKSSVYGCLAPLRVCLHRFFFFSFEPLRSEFFELGSLMPRITPVHVLVPLL
jgi:hypothetical protein